MCSRLPQKSLLLLQGQSCFGEYIWCPHNSVSFYEQEQGPEFLDTRDGQFSSRTTGHLNSAWMPQDSIINYSEPYSGSKRQHVSFNHEPLLHILKLPFYDQVALVMCLLCEIVDPKTLWHSCSTDIVLVHRDWFADFLWNTFYAYTYQMEIPCAADGFNWFFSIKKFRP